MDEDDGMMMEGMQDMPRSEMPQDGNPYSSLPQGIPPPNMPSVEPLPPQGGMPPYNVKGEAPPSYIPGGKPNMDPNALQDFIGKLLQHGQGRRIEDLLNQNTQQAIPDQEKLEIMRNFMAPMPAPRQMQDEQIDRPEYSSRESDPRMREDKPPSQGRGLVVTPEELMRSYYEKRQPGAPDQAAEMVRNLMGRRV